MEFAIVAPVMSFLLVAAFDVAHTLYMRSVLQGIVQKTARDATLESGLESDTQTTLDNRVRDQVSAIANNATTTISRKYYRNYAAAAVQQYEPFTDTDRNGRCNNGEPYEDTNNNSRWDNSGNTGQGNARDAVLYTVSVSYPRFFPVYGFLGGSNSTTVTATTVLRNQPYGDQATPAVRNCQ
ncbi:TadE/TadG family type IV pilus assembly protein [Sphingomonas canadensis]|uniref:TadE/TadG family type IV pilus assembly protein n=1 Tax=Sphingomonas canadensis TaxID=1219257 RepID=A0ABW3H6J4_9SPHN|nr:TadE/TadG family type IV pilus assembly protein [Sphingomonas canadensis]MCW3836862.1 pilus assembly protein [Sphingomonas canadensis]